MTATKPSKTTTIDSIEWQEDLSVLCNLQKSANDLGEYEGRKAKVGWALLRFASQRNPRESVPCMLTNGLCHSSSSSAPHKKARSCPSWGAPRSIYQSTWP